MTTKRAHEGYYMLDNRESPGVPEALVVGQGLPATAARGLFESATFTCSHCETVVVKNPDRSRERAWCKKCDHYICDGCGAELARTGVCYPFKAMIADFLNEVDKKPRESEVSQSSVILLP